jgi:prefoldin alpha subunit
MSMAAPPTEQQVQEELARLDAYRSQLNAMLQQLQYLSASRAEHLRAREALDGLERLHADGEILVPLGGDTFVRGTPMKDSPVLVGVGSGVVVEMDRAQVTEVLTERMTKIEQAAGDLEGQARALDERIQLLSRRLESLSQGGQGRDALAPEDVGGD